MFKKNWHKNKYISFVKDIITPRFLIDLIMPKDITNSRLQRNDINIPVGYDIINAINGRVNKFNK